jgi:hypothetical protein
MAQMAAVVFTLAAAQLCVALCIAGGLFLWKALR